MSDFSTNDLRQALARVSDDVKREVGALIPQAADAMVGRLEARYPYGEKHDPRVPHMRDDISIRSVVGNDVLLPARKVRGPRLAFIWQDGTRDRTDATRKNARRGRMPAADPKFFERAAAQTRAEMMHQAQAILDRPRTIG